MSPVALDLRGRHALVTGGSRGIGRAVAEALAAAGARVGIGYRSNRAAAEAALQGFASAPGGPGGGHWAEGADLATATGAEALYHRVDREFAGRIDVFVGNAGIWNATPVPYVELEDAEWRRMMDANLASAHRTTREALRRMGGGGRVVLITSTAAQRGEPGHAHYAASKGALQSLVKSLAAEVGPAGITVNAVAPGWVDTDMTADVLRGPERDRIVSGIPLRRIPGPEDIAGPVLFLVSDLARHVTGEILNVNGGSVLCG